MADLLLLSLFAGLYSVPMYALIQLRSAAHAPRAHHRRQQHPERAVHDRQQRSSLGLLLKAGFSDSARFSSSSAWPMPWWRSTSSCWCLNTCCASWPGWLSRLGVPLPGNG
jgi:hypothetical protein